MDKIIKVAGKDMWFRATALTPRLYRHKIGRDIVRDMNRLQKSYTKAVESAKLTPPGPEASPQEKEAYEAAVKEAQLSVVDLEIFENVAYIMARQYDPAIPATADEWLDGIEGTFSVYEILPQILELWQLNNQTTSTSKKK